MTVRLATIENGTFNPFEVHPQLREIWPEPYAREAEIASHVDAHSGQILYILNDGTVVGITGIFFDDKSPKDVFLRWSGIIPMYRRQHLMTQAFEHLLRLIIGLCPERERLIELVPDNEYGHNVALPFFLDAGFEKDPAFQDAVNIPEGEGADWPVFPVVFDLR